MRKTTSYILIFLFALILTGACASIGNPQGGPYDETPPKVLYCSPLDKTTNNNKKKINITFNEYIKIENASEKIVFSPPQLEMPDVRTYGKRITVELFDTLKENTTYTIDFADAIVDNNEGNPLGQFTYSFSTGATIDTMEVSGTVLDASNLEPIKGILVGLYSGKEDSLFQTKGMERVARTNGSGKFTIKGIAPGSYRIYALADMDGNFMYNQKAEQIAFDTTIIIPSSAPDIRYDTIWKDSTHIDSIISVPYTHYYPDDIVLKAFQESIAELHLLKIERPFPDRFSIYFTAPSDTLPSIRGFNFNAEKAFLLEHSIHNDTLTYWIQDTIVANKDTLHFALTYLDTDTLGNLVSKTDTLELSAKVSREKLAKERQKKQEEWEKEYKQKLRRNRKKDENKNGKQYDSIPPLPKEYMAAKVFPAGSLAPDQNVTLTFTEPILHIDSSKISFKKKVDTLWVDEPYLFVPSKHDIKSFQLYAEWRPNQQYQFVADTAAFINIFGKESNKIDNKFQVKPLESFGAIFIRLDLAKTDSNAVVQLLNNSDKVVKTVKAVNNRADFFFLNPGTYYVRMFLDRNGNGKWDIGNFEQGQQAEEVFYFPKPLPVTVRMELEQEWDVRGIPLVKQKPLEITKQKPDKEKTIKNRNAEYYKNLNK